MDNLHRPLAAMAALLLLLGIFTSAAQAQGPEPAPSPPHADSFEAPPPPPQLAGASWRGPSQYMAGRVAVALILPESSGAVDPSSEDWSPALQADVEAQVRSALDWWEARLPAARLSFELYPQLVPTAYEPVRYGAASEGVWIDDVLRNMGYGGTSHYDRAYQAVSDLRARTGADWATLIFVANSAASPSSYLPDGRFAYAYINGPYMVLTSDVGGYGTTRMAPVVAHELGHIFGALDQYASAQVPCTRRSGYLGGATGNSQYQSCGTRNPSIMLEPLGAFSQGHVDPGALLQIGYHDSDRDGLIDPLDTAPAIQVGSGGLASLSGRPVIIGSVADIGFPSPLQPAASINPVVGLEYRVNGGDWQAISAADGAFDSLQEEFRAELPLYDGDYRLELRAINAAGVERIQDGGLVQVRGIGPQPDYQPAAPALSASRQISVDLAAPAGTEWVQISQRPDFAGAPWQPYQPSLGFSLDGPDGQHSIYLRFRDFYGLVSLAYRLPVTLDTEAPSARVSRSTAGQVLIEAHDATSGLAEVEVQVADQAPQWLPFSPSLELAAAADAPVTIRLRDTAGNTSAPYLAAVSYATYLPLVVR